MGVWMRDMIPPRGLQWVGICIGLAQLVLLIATYALGGRASDAYVSDELDSLSGFRILLTLTVMTQIFLGVYYLYDWGGPRDWRVWVGGLGGVFALTGWSILASTTRGTVDHVTGTLIYLAGTAQYFVLMIDMRPESEYAEIMTWTLAMVTGGVALAFVVTQNIKDAEGASITIEWVGFMLEAMLFSLFFGLHSFKEGATTLPPREEYRPLFRNHNGNGNDVESGLI